MNAIRLAAVAAAVAGLASAALAGDLIQKKDGTFQPPIKGETPEKADYEASTAQVLDADIDEITYQVSLGGKNVTQKFKSADVLEIWLDEKDYPPQWKEALDSMTGGDYPKAAKLFQAIGAEARVHRVVRQKSLLYAARCIGAQGQAAGADQAYDALLKSFPKTFYTVALWKDRSQLWMDANDEAKARQAAEQILKLPGASDSDKLEARFLLVTVDFRKAVAAREQAGIQKSLDAYKSIAGETAGKPALANVNALAKVGQGNALLELGTVNDAKGIFEEISQRAKDPAVCAAAFNGLGECWFRQNDKKGFEEARRCFLRTALLYAEGAPADQVAKAFYYAGECFFRLQDSDDWKDRSRKELVSAMRFTGSPWAQKAKSLLNAVPK